MPDKAVSPWGPAGYLVSLPARPVTFCSDIDQACQVLLARWRHVETAAAAAAAVLAPGEVPPPGDLSASPDASAADASAQLTLGEGADPSPLIVMAAAWLALSAPAGRATLCLPVRPPRSLPDRLALAIGGPPALGLHGPGASSFAALVAGRVGAELSASTSLDEL